jgi:anti-sigma B factor antagonist
MYHPPSAELEVEEIADGLLVRPIGEMDLNSSPAFRDEMRQLQISMPARLVMDMTNVPYMDSSAVATLVEAMQTARRSDGILVLCGLQDRVRGILEVSRLDRSVLTIVDTTDQAIAIPTRRKFKRFCPESLTCDRGEIVDISAGGMKIRSRRRLRRRVKLRLRSDTIELPLVARVAWSRRLGFRRYEIGLSFVDLTTHDARELAAIVGRLRVVAERHR